MGLLAVVGIVLIIVGLLGLFKVLAISLAIALLTCIVGLLLVVFGGRFNSRV